MDICLDFIKKIVADHHQKTSIICKATGGGAFKFASKLESLGLKVEKEDEMVRLLAFSGSSF